MPNDIPEPSSYGVYPLPHPVRYYKAMKAMLRLMRHMSMGMDDMAPKATVVEREDSQAETGHLVMSDWQIGVAVPWKHQLIRRAIPWKHQSTWLVSPDVNVEVTDCGDGTSIIEVGTMATIVVDLPADELLQHMGPHLEAMRARRDGS